MEDNSFAGNGSVLLDIGGDVGALIVTMPAELEGQEIEIRPTAQNTDAPSEQSHEHVDPHGHSHGHSHEHGSHLIHVGVVARPTPEGPIHSAVFAELPAGQYELYVRPAGPVELTATVRGASVTFADWPEAQSA